MPLRPCLNLGLWWETRAELGWRTAVRASQAGGQMEETGCFHHCSLLLFSGFFFPNHLRAIRKGVIWGDEGYFRQHVAFY